VFLIKGRPKGKSVVFDRISTEPPVDGFAPNLAETYTVGLDDVNNLEFFGIG